MYEVDILLQFDLCTRCAQNFQSQSQRLCESNQTKTRDYYILYYPPPYPI